MEIEPIHEQLPIISETTLSAQPNLVHLVTFLNRSLKRRGFIFGLRQLSDGRHRLVIYDANQAPQPVPGKGQSEPEEG